MSSLKDKLLWYQRHQDEVLDYRHRFLADFELFDLKRWSRATVRAHVKRLNNARRYFQRECKHQAINQSMINNWLLQRPSHWRLTKMMMNQQLNLSLIGTQETT